MNKTNEILVGLLICLSFFLQIYSVSALYIDDGSPVQNVNNCSGAGGLNTSGATYRLTQDLTEFSYFICINLANDGITLDCQGHSITYSILSNENGMTAIATSGIATDFITIKNCRIIQDSSLNANSTAISFYGDNGRIENTTITTLGDESVGIELHNSDNNILLNNNIITSGIDSYGIYILGSSNNNITDTIISTASYDVVLKKYYIVPRLSMNNIFLNTTYSTESVDLSSELIRQWYLDVNVNNAVYYLPNANIIGYDKNNNFIFSELTDNSGNIPTQDLTEYTKREGVSVNISVGVSSVGYFPAPAVFYDGSAWQLVFGEYNANWYGYTWDGTQWVSNSTIVTGLYVYDDGNYAQPMIWEMNGNIYLIGYTNRVTYGNMRGYQWNGVGWTSNSSLVSGFYSLFRGEPPIVFNIGSNWYAILYTFGADDYHGYQWSGSGWTENTSVVGLHAPYSSTFYFDMNGNSYSIYPKDPNPGGDEGILGNVWNTTTWISAGSNITIANYYSNYTINTTLAYYNDSSQSVNMSMNRFLNIILAWNGTALPTTPPMSWEEVDLNENIVDPNNTEQGLLPSVYYGLATFLSNIMTPAIIIIFVVFICLIMVTIGTIIKKIAMRI